MRRAFPQDWAIIRILKAAVCAYYYSTLICIYEKKLGLNFAVRAVTNRYGFFNCLYKKAEQA
jgi:hypothetical protein